MITVMVRDDLRIGLSLFILDEPTWAPWATGIITVCRPLSSDWIITIHTR